MTRWIHRTRLPGGDRLARLLVPFAALTLVAGANAEARHYPVVDTGQTACYDAAAEVACPGEGEGFRGQDAQYTGSPASYTDNGDGTISDNVTGLMWQKSPDLDGDGDIDAADKRSFDDAMAQASGFTLAGYDDWRLPTIKELYSLIDFSGIDPIVEGGNSTGLRPFLDTDTFDFAYGDVAAGERIIDAQYVTSTLYVAGTGPNDDRTVFGVNFADGRIKGYGLRHRGAEKTFFVLHVRGAEGYGVNDFVDNGDGTLTDRATGLIWSRDDSGKGMSWQAALSWVEARNAEGHLGHSDWRLPNAKELQSIVDYTRSPDTTGSAAIDPLLNASEIVNEDGEPDYAFYWTSTTHLGPVAPVGGSGIYVAFGRSLGYMAGSWVDAHGAGSQRSDPKAGDPADFPTGRGPQGDAIRIENHVRLVRGGGVAATPGGGPTSERERALPAVGSGPAREPTETRVPAGRPSSGDRGRGNRSRARRRGPRQPPPEAVAACVDRRRGDACAFTSPHGEVTGTCASIQERLACAPAGGPPGPPRP